MVAALSNLGNSLQIIFTFYSSGISNENNFAQVRVDNLKAEQTILLKKLDEIIQNTIPAFFDTQKTQDDRLDNVKQKVA